MNSFKFNIGETVGIVGTQLSGEVVGRAEFKNATPDYYVRYVDAQGNPRTEWFDGERLTI